MKGKQLMQILIIDDDIDKIVLLNEAITRISADNKIETITHSENTLSDGIKCLEEIKYDLLILDMQFPIYKGCSIERDMGVTFLEYMKSKEIKIDTVVCSYGYTGYDYIKKAGFLNMIKQYISADHPSLREMLESVILDIQKHKFL